MTAPDPTVHEAGDDGGQDVGLLWLSLALLVMGATALAGNRLLRSRDS